MNNYKVVRKNGEKMYIYSHDFMEDDGRLAFYNEGSVCVVCMDPDEIAYIYSEPAHFSDCVFQDGKKT